MSLLPSTTHPKQTTAVVGIIMGSQSDWPTLKHAAAALNELGIAYECAIVSAHRTPAWMADYASQAHSRGLRVIIAGAGGAAHLPGMVAAHTPLPVLGVPIQSKALNGLDSLLSIVQMPAGVPVATLAIGNAGASNAGLLAASILATNNTELTEKLVAKRAEQACKSRSSAPADDPLFVASNAEIAVTDD